MRSAFGVVNGYRPAKSSRQLRREAALRAWQERNLAEAREEARYNALTLSQRIEEADDIHKLKTVLQEILTRLSAEGIEL